MRMFKILSIAMLFLWQAALGQLQTYEGRSLLHGTRSGILELSAPNPKTNDVNGNPRCTKYTRNATVKYDFIRLNVAGKFGDVAPFATYTGNPPRLKMKLYTTAPVGTIVEIQLGKRGGITYPDGTHSQYQAKTTKSGEWEEIEFYFSQIPQGSATSSTQINQVTLLFNPGSQSSDVYYFDSITGPAIGTDHSESATSINTKQ